METTPFSMESNSVVERLVRIETKLDTVVQQQIDQGARLGRAEGFIQSLERSDAVIANEIAIIKEASKARDELVKAQGTMINGLQVVMYRAIGGGAVLLAVIQLVIAFVPKLIHP